MAHALDSVRNSSRPGGSADEVDLGRPAAERHVPVLLAECLDMLAPAIDAPGAVLVDATLGMGGHTEGALERFDELTVIGIDRDPQAIALASARLERFGSRFRAVHTTYDRIDEAVAEQCGPGARIDGVLMDLGVSSLQLDEADRGFAYSKDAPLDMRMDATAGRSAADLLATASEGELIRILRTYGEEKFAPRIARLIIRRRDDAPITRTGELVDIIREAIPAPARRTGGNPAKRTFQALRVAVNDELTILERALPRALSCLRVGGRLVVESKTSCAAGPPAPHPPGYRSSPTRWPPASDCSPRARIAPTEPNKTTTPDRLPCDCAERNSFANGRIPHECSNCQGTSCGPP